MSNERTLQEFGDLIKLKRERLGWTRGDLADKSDLSKQWIDRIEQGRANVSYLVM